VNSYKRLVPGYEAPVHVCWGRHSRSAFVRVPPPKQQASTRIELRSPDPACNPYLSLAVALAAGLDGIRGGLALPPEATGNIDAMTASERAALDIRPLPESLMEAIEELERSALARSALGDFVLEWFVRNKRREWAQYRAEVTPFEIERYLTVL
jgi:glutamine synthetase